MQGKIQKSINFCCKGFISFSIVCLLAVSIMAITDPQSVMDLVAVQLPNTDALSSIRGVYGATGISISISLIYLIFKNQTLALVFLAMLWGLYAFARIITIVVDGNLGEFGGYWLQVELILFTLACLLLIAYTRKTSKKTPNYASHT